MARKPWRRTEQSGSKRKKPAGEVPRKRTAWSYGWHHRASALVAADAAQLEKLKAERARFELDVAWDGHRVVACRVDDEVRLFADDMREWTDPFAPLVLALKALDARDFVLDGFVCLLDESGRPSFEKLRAWVGGQKEGQLVYAAWDLLRLDEVDLRPLCLSARRARLSALLTGAGSSLVCSAALEGEIDSLRAKLEAAGLPGFVARLAEAAFPPAEPWLSVSCTERGAVAARRALSIAPTVTNKQKVLYPRDGITKQDIVDFYADLAPVLLPYMRNRPIVSQRWPDGIDEFTWFQHRVPPRAPDYLEAVLIEGNRRILINNEDALLWMANQAALTFHGWASRVGSLKNPDWVVLDLDPGETSTWQQLIDVALALRHLLELLEVKSVVKTSGQKGLHVLVPIGPGNTPEMAHAFARGVAELIHRLMPDVVSLEAEKVVRRGRLFLDHLQNYAGKTLVLPYSLRAVDGACVSTPLDWSEVTPSLDPKSFTLKTLRRRLDATGDLFAAALTGTVALGPLVSRLR